MTRYGFDPDSGAIWASWPTGRGPRACPVVRGSALGSQVGLRVAEQLEWLSENVWRCYTDPPAPRAAQDPFGGDAWAREQDRAALDGLPAAVRDPAMPDQWGSPRPADSWIGELAQQLGRELRAAGAGAEVVTAVAAELAQEAAAVAAAERGQLDGRAEQAIELGSPDPSPLQVSAADQLLRADPLTPAASFATMDPTAAAVAAAHWLAAAATVTAAVWHGPVQQVVEESDNIDAVPVPTPTEVLARIQDGATPRQVVVGLVNAARSAATGAIPDPERLLAEFDDARERARRFRELNLLGDPTVLLPQRVCALDPRRPANDLLEDLTLGIEGCWRLYGQYVDSDEKPIWDLDDGDPDPDEVDAEEARVRMLFGAAVIAEADRHQDRLA